MDYIFAHRGASQEAPENTLPAFELALKQGCKAIELDVHLSKDGHIMVCHDEQLHRTTNGQGFIKDLTLEELKSFDAGSWFSTEYTNVKIPTLPEVLELCDRSILINVEIKNVPLFYRGIEEKIIHEIKRFGFTQNTLISSFDHHALLRVQGLEPTLKLGALLANHLIKPVEYLRMSGLKAYSIHPVYTFINEAFIQESHEAGLKVFAFTVDEIETYQALKQVGTDGIFTNIPKRFLSI